MIRKTEPTCRLHQDAAVRVATQYAPPFSPRGRPSASCAAEQTQLAVLSHAEYVPTLTAAFLIYRSRLVTTGQTSVSYSYNCNSIVITIHPRNYLRQRGYVFITLFVSL